MKQLFQETLAVMDEAFGALEKAVPKPQRVDHGPGNPPRFHLSGMLGTPRINEHADDLWNYFYRALLSIIGAAKAFGDKQLARIIHDTPRIGSARASSTGLTAVLRG